MMRAVAVASILMVACQAFSTSPVQVSETFGLCSSCSWLNERRMSDLLLTSDCHSTLFHISIQRIHFMQNFFLKMDANQAFSYDSQCSVTSDFSYCSSSQNMTLLTTRLPFLQRRSIATLKMAAPNAFDASESKVIDTWVQFRFDVNCSVRIVVNDHVIQSA